MAMTSPDRIFSTSIALTSRYAQPLSLERVVEIDKDVKEARIQYHERRKHWIYDRASNGALYLRQIVTQIL